MEYRRPLYSLFLSFSFAAALMAHAGRPCLIGQYNALNAEPLSARFARAESLFREGEGNLLNVSRKVRLEVSQQPNGPKARAIDEAHAVGQGHNGDYTPKELLAKARILKEAGFTFEEREALMRGGVTGVWGKMKAAFWADDTAQVLPADVATPEEQAALARQVVQKEKIALLRKAIPETKGSTRWQEQWSHGDINASDAKLEAELTASLSHKDPKVRAAAVSAWAEVFPSRPEMFKNLFKALGDKNEGVRFAAAQSLAESSGLVGAPDPDAGAALAGMLKSKSLDVRAAADQALRVLKPKDLETYVALIDAAENKDPSVAKSATEILEYLGVRANRDPKFQKGVKSALELKNIGGDFARKREIFWSLRNFDINEPKLTEFLIRVPLNDPDASVRSSIVQLLERTSLSEPETQRAIAGCLGDSDQYVRQNAIKALAKSDLAVSDLDVKLVGFLKITAKNFRDLTPLYPERRSVGVAFQDGVALFLRTKSRNPDVLAALVEVLGDAYRDDVGRRVRIDSVRALGELKPTDPKVHQVLIDALKSDFSKGNKEVAIAELEALGKIKPAMTPELQEIVDQMQRKDFGFELVKKANEAVRALSSQPRVNEPLSKAKELVLARFSESKARLQKSAPALVPVLEAVEQGLRGAGPAAKKGARAIELAFRATEMREKVQFLKDGGFDVGQREAILRSGLAGVSERGSP